MKVEAISHLFYYCSHIQDIWNQVQAYFDVCTRSSQLTPQTSTFGFRNVDDDAFLIQEREREREREGDIKIWMVLCGFTFFFIHFISLNMHMYMFIDIYIYIYMYIYLYIYIIYISISISICMVSIFELRFLDYI